MIPHCLVGLYETDIPSDAKGCRLLKVSKDNID